ncbi:Uncharacterised protein [uncultured Blautia sp.]|nr:Uncharacterised protein [uncultured Blautia sp.]
MFGNVLRMLCVTAIRKDLIQGHVGQVCYAPVMGEGSDNAPKFFVSSFRDIPRVIEY